MHVMIGSTTSSNNRDCIPSLRNYIHAIIEVVELLPNTKDLNKLIKIYLSENP